MGSVTPLNQSFCNNAAAKRASRRLGTFYDEILAPSRLRAMQHALLQQIARLGAPKLSDLAQALVLDRSALSHTLHPLERDNVVKISPYKLDRRAKVVALTEVGKDRLEIANKLWRMAQGCFEASYGVQEAQKLRLVLDQLASLDFADRPRITAIRQQPGASV